MKLLELQELVMRLVGERNEWYTKYMMVTQNPETTDPGSEAVVTAERRLELNATDGEGLREVSLTDEPEQELAVPPSHPFHADGRGPPPAPQDPTAKQIMRLLREIQNPRERLGSLLENPCIPFFYRADENDEVKIMVV